MFWNSFFATRENNLGVWVVETLSKSREHQVP
jgi:hypothetical protein